MATATLTCDACGCEIADENDMQEGMCEKCFSDWSPASYCCGMIYEDGEDTCASCGESL